MAHDADERIKRVAFSEERMDVAIPGGRTLSAPLNWYPPSATRKVATLR